MKSKVSVRSRALAAVVSFTVTLSVVAEDWPQWRGPSRDGAVSGPIWPAGLDDGRLKLRWQHDLEEGYSGPLIVGDRIFTVETVGKKREVVRAFDRKDGSPLWKTSWEGAMSVPFFARANGSWVRSTPTYADGRLYVAGMRDVLVCLDAETGSVQWKVDFVKRDSTPLPTFGFVCSPLVVGGHVYVQAGGALQKLDAATGETVWKSLGDGGGMGGSAFSSPVMVDLHGRAQLIVQTRTTLAGVDPKSGDVLWSQKVKAFRGMNILTPVVHEGGVVTSTYGGRTSLFATRKSDAGIEVDLAWDNKLQGYMSNPAVFGGHAYIHLRNQRMACVDLADGEIQWTTGRKFGKYMSMVAQGDRILGLDQKGILYLMRANPKEFELIDERRVTERESWAHLAVADGQLCVRDLKGVMLFDWGHVAAGE